MYYIKVGSEEKQITCFLCNQILDSAPRIVIGITIMNYFGIAVLQ